MGHIEAGQIWKHHKGGLYRIVAVANNANTHHEIINYQSVNEEDKTVWWHYIGEFLSTTDEGKDRFTLVEEPVVSQV